MNFNIPVNDQRVLDNWFDSISDHAISKNYQASENWNRYKEDCECTKSNLEWIPKKLSHNVMVPVGPRAFMRGKMVHTNEFLVNLGDNWFVKRTACQTIEICQRRIINCEDMLTRLENERKLIAQRKQLPAEEVFGSKERPEIIEQVTEDEEMIWREEHRKKEKEYRQKLSEIRKNETKNVETEEDLWKRLDELELIEELEDELNRLHADDSQSDEEEEDEEAAVNGGLDVLVHSSLKKNGIIQPDITDVAAGINIHSDNKTIVAGQNDTNGAVTLEDSRNESNQCTTKVCASANVDECPTEPTLDVKKPKSQVSFSDSPNEVSDDEPLILKINHTANEYFSNFYSTGFVNSPGDIYLKYKESRRKKSILKISKNPNQEIETIAVQKLDQMNEFENEKCVNSSIYPGIDICDIYERNADFTKEIHISEQPKKLSKFKMSRLKK